MLSACARIDVAPLDSSERQGSLSLLMQSSSIRQQNIRDVRLTHLHGCPGLGGSRLRGRHESLGQVEEAVSTFRI